MANPKSPKSTKTSKKTPRSTKSAAKEATAKFSSKSDFVRSQPSLSAPELVDLAKKNGVKLTTSHVYNIRATDKKKRLGGGVVGGARGVASSAGGPAAASDADREFFSLCLRLGTDRIDQLLGEFRASSSVFASPAQTARTTRRRVAPTESTSRPATLPPPATQEASQSTN